MCMIVWDVVSSRALPKFKNVPCFRNVESLQRNEKTEHFFEPTKVDCQQLARCAHNHPARVRPPAR